MSSVNRSIRHEAVIPVVRSAVFADMPDTRFAAGTLAVRDQAIPGLDSEYAGYFDLRRRVYVDQTGQLAQSDLAPDGTDRDTDDARSVAFGIIENRGVDQRIVAAARLIIKGFGHETDDSVRPLPIEDFYSDIFETSAPTRSIEVSRLIVRHERSGIQESLRWYLYSVVLAHIALNNLGPTYGVVEPWLERYLNATIPVSRLGEARFVKHYNDDNVPIEVHTDKFIELVEGRDPALMAYLRHTNGAMTYFGTLRRPRDELAA